MLVLTSNGLSSKPLLETVKEEVIKQNYSKAVLVVTADNEYKENNWIVQRLIDELKACGLSIDLFDFDKDSPEILNHYDVIEFNGGNPFYLLDRLNKAHMKPVLEEFLEQDKIIIGMSAGSFVLQNNINLVNEYSEDMNTVNLRDLNAMALTDIEILPHYSRFIKTLDNFEKICKHYEEANDISVIRISNGEGVIINDNILKTVRLQK